MDYFSRGTEVQSVYSLQYVQRENLTIRSHIIIATTSNEHSSMSNILIILVMNDDDVCTFLFCSFAAFCLPFFCSSSPFVLSLLQVLLLQ